MVCNRLNSNIFKPPNINAINPKQNKAGSIEIPNTDIPDCIIANINNPLFNDTNRSLYNVYKLKGY